MADEAIPVENTRQAPFLRSYTVANSPAVTKYTLMYISGDNTASYGGVASGAQFAGIAVFEKAASDGQTEITCDIGGVWDLTASGAIPRMHKVVLAGGNRIMDADLTTAAVAASGGLIVGTVLETASDGEVVRTDLTRR